MRNHELTLFDGPPALAQAWSAPAAPARAAWEAAPPAVVAPAPAEDATHAEWSLRGLRASEMGDMMTFCDRLGIDRFGAEHWPLLGLEVAQAWVEVATGYIAAITPTNDFTASVRDRARSAKGLSDAQAAAVITMMVREARSMARQLEREIAAERGELDPDLEIEQADDYARWQRAQESRAHDAYVRTTTGADQGFCDVPGLADVPSATYTLARADGHVTIRFREWLREGRPVAGKRAVQILTGPDNETNFQTVASIEGNDVRLFSRYRADGEVAAALRFLAGGTIEDHDTARFTYAQRSGKCARCNRTLTVPASINRGLGPDCAAREW